MGCLRRPQYESCLVWVEVQAKSMIDNEQLPTLVGSAVSTPSSIAPIPPYSIFDSRQKNMILILVSTAASFSGFASNIYFPALPILAHDLHVSTELINLTVTSYLIFQGFAPSLWGPVSDVKGRRIAYIYTLTIFLGSCIGLALAKNFATLIILRCLQSTGSASTIAIGSGVIGDITTRENRGGYMGIFQAGMLVPVAVGPVIGGVLAGSLGWRAIFWFLTIYCGTFLFLLLLLLPETLRSVVANGSITPRNALIRFPLTIYRKFSKTEGKYESVSLESFARNNIDILGPLHILSSRTAAPIIVFLAIYYAVWQTSITAMSTLFERNYGLGVIQIGLTFIANGIGSMIGTLITGKILNIEFQRVKRRFENSFEDICQRDYEDNFPIEKARLRLVPVFSLLQCMSILIFGWTIQYPERVHIAVPIVMTFITGWTAVSTQSVIMTYLVDIFPDRSAAASASLNLARCLLAAGGTSIIMPMTYGIGVGWAFTICVIVQLLAMIGPLVQWKWGGAWRKEEAIKHRAAAAAAM